jgi:hypothetical protein
MTAEHVLKALEADHERSMAVMRHYRATRSKASRSRDALRNKAWVAAHPAAAYAHAKKYKLSNPQRTSARRCCYRARWRGSNHDQPFLESLPCPTHCPILGTPISFDVYRGKRPSENTASFDQIVPGAGYVEGNVRIISLLANAMLQNALPAQRYAMGRWLVNEYADTST